ncbi:gfo/Idh/MocA family oxidoreductase [Actinoplanes sp. LDG1-06]|uniref:Gfo/Idh/MocA family oxidoreductase n=1 Tax=Paractinoplanes ovalisporus TaxID=2810368 RepID=A0ABS2ABF1_9ACTN|nr:gfo/Idh/MocA family oxidoreductase [Actinoplanes ovalisporus]MBM2617154.1 gfo/Idh/MocA family oxidoreductase [Actinoplanes ovalisporus]
MTTFALVGFGFRAEAFFRVARALDDVVCVGAVVREPGRRVLPVPAFGDLTACVREARPDFLITGVPRAATPAIVAEAVAQGLPVLAETPPAPDRDGLRALWTAVGGSGLVQVAEQYLLMPSHAARLAAVRSGIIGTPTQVQVSSTQQYHAMSLVRGFLGVGHEPAAVRAVRTVAPLLNPLDRGGWTDTDQPEPATTTIATLDFGRGRSGLYDFTSNQTRNLLRFRRLLVRGTHGELQDDEIVHMPAPRTIARTPLSRRQSGHDLDLNGLDTETITLDGEVLHRNPYVGSRFNDDEIATAALLEAMAAWVRGEGPPPYPLAEGAQDHLLALAVDQAAETGREIITSVEAWSLEFPSGTTS